MIDIKMFFKIEMEYELTRNHNISRFSLSIQECVGRRGVEVAGGREEVAQRRGGERERFFKKENCFRGKRV